ncbi:hypothetical protein [Geodermatophilus sp. SYSU D00815]
MPEHLPVVVVDDKHELLDAVRRRLEYRGWEVTTYDDIDEAARRLVDRTDPYVLILDHDFDRPDGRTGMDLSKLLRAAHPWGVALPISYYSGRIGGEEFLAALREDPMAVPSSYTHKSSDVSVVELVELAEATFFRHRATYEQQALRRAVLDLDTALPVDDHLDGDPRADVVPTAGEER